MSGNQARIGNPRRRRFATAIAGAATLALMCGATGFYETEQAQPNIIAKAGRSESGAYSGFLGDYGLLQPGGQGQALYRYIAPNVDWSQYNAVMLDPVAFWDSSDSSVPPDKQQMLCTYFYNQLQQSLAKYFQVVDQPGPVSCVCR